MKKNALFSKAFEYAVRGYSVMPLKKDKRPMLTTWKTYQSKAASEEQIQSWWERWPDANVGIITGEISGITVIDVDAYKAGGTKLDAFPETFTVKTGNGGYHLYYKYQKGLTISANKYPQFPGVDIRSDGGYIVAPPSVTEYLGKGGPYEVFKAVPLAAFPAKLFDAKKAKRSVSSLIGISTGGRNDSITSFIGQLLRAEDNEKKWGSEVWPAVQRANKTYSPPLGERELKTTFDSIVKKEQGRRAAMILSPIQINDGEGGEVKIPIRRNAAGSAYRDMTNAHAVLSHHPYFKGNIKFNTFRQEIEYNGRPFEEADLTKMQYFMQKSTPLAGISKEAVYAGVSHYANENSYDEAQDFLKALKWDKKKRLLSWISKATSVEDDAYHQAIGAQWFAGMIRRIMLPGATFDHMLVLVGPQGIGKTSLFRIIGGPWYKSYTGAIDNKDFYLALRGAVVVDLDEGAALYRSEAIKIKSIITETHDEFRAPYDRVMKKYPRRFVFSMSTNDTEPLRDVTGNRRYWTIDATEQIDFKWLEKNRDQLFAEAYHYWKNKTSLPEVPMDEALARQEMHVPDDSWTELVMTQLQKSLEYCRGEMSFSATIIDVYSRMFPQQELAHLGRGQEMRLAQIFKKQGGLEKKRMLVDGEQRSRWVLTPKRAAELQERNAADTRDEFDKP